MLGDNVLDHHIPFCYRSCEHERSCLDLVGDYRISGAVELIHAFYPYNVGTGTFYVGTHAVKEVCNINDVRFLRRILDDRLS